MPALQSKPVLATLFSQIPFCEFTQVPWTPMIANSSPVPTRKFHAFQQMPWANFVASSTLPWGMYHTQAMAMGTVSQKSAIVLPTTPKQKSQLPNPHTTLEQTPVSQGFDINSPTVNQTSPPQVAVLEQSQTSMTVSLQHHRLKSFRNCQLQHLNLQ